MKDVTKRKSKKIFIGISETSGFYGRIYKGLKELGVDCYFAQLIPNRHNYSYTLPCDNWVLRLARKSYYDNKMIFAVIKLLVFVWALCKFDTFVLSDDCGFFRNTARELKILKLFGKKRVYINLGWYTRLPYAQGKYLAKKEFYFYDKPNVANFVKEIEHRTQVVKEMEENIDVYFNFPPQAQLCRKKFISLCYIGNPIDLSDKEENNVETFGKKEKRIRILHAPSDVGKGTEEIRECINKLKNKYELDYIELINVSNDIVLKEIKKCDFVIDQIYSDAPLAAFPTEAAYYGKPAVVCGYFSEFYKEYYPLNSLPPSIFTLPEDLYVIVEELICNEEFRRKKGKEIQRFVTKNMNSKAVAKRFYKAINGEIDPIWIVDPLKIDYINGWGINKKVQNQIIKEIYHKAGIQRMGTMHNTLLTEKIIEVVNLGSN